MLVFDGCTLSVALLLVKLSLLAFFLHPLPGGNKVVEMFLPFLFSD